jgi:hypothetical protein
LFLFVFICFYLFLFFVQNPAFPIVDTKADRFEISLDVVVYDDVDGLVYDDVDGLVYDDVYDVDGLVVGLVDDDDVYGLVVGLVDDVYGDADVETGDVDIEQ